MKISVALCTYNGERFVEEQLKSILNQSVPVDEIVICDDSSKDSTVQLARQLLENSGVSHKILVNDPPLGVANNFLKALKHTGGDYVFTSDQDDIWHQDKVAVFREAALKTQKDLYFSDGFLVDAEAKPLGATLWEAFGVDKTLAMGGPIYHMLLKNSMVTGAAMMISRKLIDRVDAIFQGVLHDEWYSMVAAADDSVEPICQQTFLYRQHGSNVVGAKKRTFLEKTDIWFQNLSKIVDIREKAYSRTCALKAAAKGTQYEKLAEEACMFWETLSGLPQKNSISQLGVVTRLLFEKKYARFYTGLRGYVRDILAALFVRR